jgi:hypothetical protein
VCGAFGVRKLGFARLIWIVQGSTDELFRGRNQVYHSSGLSARRGDDLDSKDSDSLARARPPHKARRTAPGR